MPRYLGLDVGDKRMGIAISDASGSIARALEIVDRGQKNPFKRVAALVAEHAITAIIIGNPLNEQGGTGPQAQRVAQFASTLRSLLPIPLHMQDERWSTTEANEAIKINMKLRNLPRHDDAVAAAIILQRYLDEHHQANH